MNQTQSITTPPNISRHHEQVGGYQTSSVSDGLTRSLESKLNAPASSPEFDLHTETNAVLKDIGLTTADAGGNLSFYGSDPILPSPMRFGTMAAVGLAARSVALAALWKQATGEGQDISVDVRKALRRFAGFFEGKWETINGRPPSPNGYAVSPFLNDLEHFFFRETRDGRHVVALDFYPRLRARTLNFLGSSESNESINNAIFQMGRSGVRGRGGGGRTGSGHGAHE